MLMPREGKPFVRADRKRLREWLAVGLEIEWGKRFLRWDRVPVSGEDNGGDAGVVAHFEDGTSARGDVLVGADGGRSRGK